MKILQAWAVLDGKNLNPCGNGNQFQYPIFFTMRETNEFIEENHGYRNPQVVRVEIKVLKER